MPNAWNRPEHWCALLVAASAGVVWVGILNYWSPAVLLTGTGLAALAAIWILYARVSTPKAHAFDELDRLTRSLDRTKDSATRSSGEHTHEPPAQRLASATQRLDEYRARVGVRLGELATALANARAVLNAIPDPVLATDSAGVVIAANPAADAFWSRDAASIVGRNILDLFTQSEVLNLHAGALAGNPAVSHVKMPRAGLPRVVEVAAVPVALAIPTPDAPASSAAEPGVAFALRDVTDLALASQLKTDFVANASHEVRTPLSSIKAAVETLRDGAADEPPMRDKLLTVVSSNVERIEELIRDLLDLSRLESPEAPVRREPVDLVALTRRVAESFERARNERHLNVADVVAPDAGIVESDPELLRLILGNLIENSTKFAFENTTITVRIDRLPPQDSTLKARRDGIRIRVIDQGIGIPLAAQPRIFERFYQVDTARTGTPARRGTGLGLAIVKHAVKRLGGTIRVESVWQQGTTMTVTIPGCLPTDPSQSTGAQSRPAN